MYDTDRKTPTPRADEQVFKAARFGAHIVPADFARGLERELIEAQEELASSRREPSEQMCDSVRGILQLIRGTPGATFKQVRSHCCERGDDLHLWPLWSADVDGYVTEQSAAKLIYEVMQANVLPAPPKEQA